MSRVLPALFKGAPRARPRHCSFTAITANPTRGPRHGSSFAGRTQLAKSNKLRQAFAENRPSMGVWQMLPGVNISRVLARTPGVDWVMVDCEHGQMTDAAMHEAVPVIAATGTTPVVRIPDFQPWMIKRALDSGAHGILVPLIRTVEEVRSVVRSCKFPPEGNRGFGSPLSMENFSPVPSLTEYLEQANDALLVMVQIETKEALEAVDEIALLVDVLFIGPFDLGNNIGHPIINGVIEAELDAAIKRVLEAGNRAGKKCGIYCTSAEMARKYAEMGFSMMSAAADYTGLQQHMAETLAIAHGKAQPQKGQSY